MPGRVTHQRRVALEVERRVSLERLVGKPCLTREAGDAAPGHHLRVAEGTEDSRDPQTVPAAVDTEQCLRQRGVPKADGPERVGSQVA